ncbi:hypothetical protein T484DRAFT_1918709 [Baffinella frigidus]|nr:hypothetical protein T484DRAFT_1918709 [Cryptophyta sp. CCMP2293]
MLLERNNSAAALPLFQRAAELAPGSGRAKAGLALALKAQGRRSEGVEVLMEARRLLLAPPARPASTSPASTGPASTGVALPATPPDPETPSPAVETPAEEDETACAPAAAATDATATSAAPGVSLSESEGTSGLGQGGAGARGARHHGRQDKGSSSAARALEDMTGWDLEESSELVVRRAAATY